MSKQALLESLAAVTDKDCLYLGNCDDGDVYFDWTYQRNGVYMLEVGVHGDRDSVLQLDLTRQELQALHAALTATLLRDAV